MRRYLTALTLACLVGTTVRAAEEGKGKEPTSRLVIDHAQSAVNLTKPDVSVISGQLKMCGKNPQGVEISANSRYLTIGGKPWFPVMGEFHYSRYPDNEWREELLKMKAGGIDIVATYVFWIHHEEIEGQFDWSGQRSLRRFIETAHDVGLKAIVRCGPWCHGEVRNGGLPDWILQKGWKTRTDDPNYLKKVRILYGEIAAQLKGLLWKDGGPVIGIQLENEYGGPAEHLLTLKSIAREVGLDVPLYTRTGWPALRTPMPVGEILPLFGAYAEGFWDRELTPMPGRYWAAFRFSPLRTDSAIATYLLGNREAKDAPDISKYPYLTCEIGGGMMNSYHRRILIRPGDVESTVLVKLGSGSTLPGYYMYHGGTNPEGKLTTLQETQATAFWNDMPVKNYDFQAPLGEFGQIRPHYHLLRRLHLFVHGWGSSLAGMPTVMPDQRPSGRDDTATLRWAVRSDGVGGFVFVNNYQRLQPMPAKEGVRFALQLRSGSLAFPAEPITVPADSRFVWPFNLELGHGVRLIWATAQPVCAVDDGDVRTVFFAETTGVPAEFAFDRPASTVKALGGRIVWDGNRVLVRDVRPGTGPALRVRGKDGAVQIVLLDEATSLALWKGAWQGRERVFLTRAGLVLDGDSLRLTSSDPTELTVGVFPSPGAIASGGRRLRGSRDGVFMRFAPAAPRAVTLQATVESVQTAGPPRTISLGKINRPVAEEPSHADFEQAAVWRIKLPRDLDLGTDPILRFHYVGDVARVMLDGKLLTDDFYNGNAFDVGLRRYAHEIAKGELRVVILPLRKDAPIYMAKEARPDFGSAESAVALERVEIVPRYQAQLDARAGGVLKNPEPAARLEPSPPVSSESMSFLEGAGPPAPFFNSLLVADPGVLKWQIVFDSRP
jgi:beta-galactosidase